MNAATGANALENLIFKQNMMAQEDEPYLLIREKLFEMGAGSLHGPLGLCIAPPEYVIITT